MRNLVSRVRTGPIIRDFCIMGIWKRIPFYPPPLSYFEKGLYQGMVLFLSSSETVVLGGEGWGGAEEAGVR